MFRPRETFRGGSLQYEDINLGQCYQHWPRDTAHIDTFGATMQPHHNQKPQIKTSPGTSTGGGML